MYTNKIFKKRKRKKNKNLKTEDVILKWQELRIPVSWKRYSLDTFRVQLDNEAELKDYDLETRKKIKLEICFVCQKT